MSTLEVVAMMIVVLEVEEGGQGLKIWALIYADLGDLGLGPNMAIVTFVHVVLKFDIHMKWWDAIKGGAQTLDYHQSVGERNSPPQFAMRYYLIF